VSILRWFDYNKKRIAGKKSLLKNTGFFCFKQTNFKKFVENPVESVEKPIISLGYFSKPHDSGLF